MLPVLPTVVARLGTRHPRGVGLWGADLWLIGHLFLANNTRFSLFSDDLRIRLISRLVMRSSAFLLAAVAAVFPSTTNGSPTSMLPSFFEPLSKSLSSLWQKPSPNVNPARRLGKRDSTSAFDHNPNGSEFLWALQDTYQGKTFFECVSCQSARIR